MEWENGEGGKGGANVNKRIKNLSRLPTRTQLLIIGPLVQRKGSTSHSLIVSREVLILTL